MLIDKTFWYKNVCIHSFLIWLLDFEWMNLNGKLDQDPYLSLEKMSNYDETALNY